MLVDVQYVLVVFLFFVVFFLLFFFFFFFYLFFFFFIFFFFPFFCFLLLHPCMMSTSTSSTTTPGSHGTYPTFPIVVRVLEARNLKLSTQRDYSLDPYCIVSFRKGILKMFTADKEGRFQSRILENTTTPMWNEEFILHPTKPGTDAIVVKVYDRDRSGKKDTLLGKVRIPIANYWNKGMVDQWFPLETTLSKTGHGEIHLLVNYNETGQMGMAPLGQGMMNQNVMTGSTTTTTTSNVPGTNSNVLGSNVNTGSAFSKEPLTTPSGFVQTSNTYPPPMGTHGESKTM
jgi:hypothetical protein